jgi:ariadne-1
MARAADVPATALAFVAEAYRQVADGRRVLRWAHAYGYFLDPERDAAKRALFDDLQNQANRWLECLHAAAELERKDLFGDGKGKGKEEADAPVVVVAAEAFRAYRQKVANLTGVTRKFLGNLVRAFETDLPEVAAAANPAK